MSESINTVHLLNHALNVDMSRMKSLSNNSANISSSGYKAEIPIVTPFEQMMPSINMETSRAASVSEGNRGAVTITRDLSMGSLQKTDNPHTFAINMMGYIQVDAYYSRGGPLSLNAHGELVLMNGLNKPLKVQGQRGTIVLDPIDFKLLPTGEIEQDGRVVDRIALFEFNEPSALHYLGNGLYDNGSEEPIESQATAPFLPGFEERSNVNSTEISIKMIEVSRQFEMNHQILKSYDSLLNSAINDLDL